MSDETDEDDGGWVATKEEVSERGGGGRPKLPPGKDYVGRVISVKKPEKDKLSVGVVAPDPANKNTPGVAFGTFDMQKDFNRKMLVAALGRTQTDGSKKVSDKDIKEKNFFGMPVKFTVRSSEDGYLGIGFIDARTPTENENKAWADEQKAKAEAKQKKDEEREARKKVQAAEDDPF